MLLRKSLHCVLCSSGYIFLRYDIYRTHKTLLLSSDFYASASIPSTDVNQMIIKPILRCLVEFFQSTMLGVSRLRTCRSNQLTLLLKSADNTHRQVNWLAAWLIHPKQPYSELVSLKQVTFLLTARNERVRWVEGRYCGLSGSYCSTPRQDKRYSQQW